MGSTSESQRHNFQENLKFFPRFGDKSKNRAGKIIFGACDRKNAIPAHSFVSVLPCIAEPVRGPEDLDMAPEIKCHRHNTGWTQDELKRALGPPQ